MEKDDERDEERESQRERYILRDDSYAHVFTF